MPKTVAPLMPQVLGSSASSDSIALRAFSVLERVVGSPVPLSLDEITSNLGLPKPTVFRILGLLKDADLLNRDAGSKRFTAGPRLTAFAVDLWRNASLRVRWHRALETAVAEIGESCNLTLLENDRVLYIDRVETPHPLRLHLDIGTRVPLHCTASGKLFLSQLPSDEVRALMGEEPFERFTEKTITTFKALEAELQKTRKTHIGVHNSELFADSVAIAVPIADLSGRYFAAVAMHAPASRESIPSSMKSLPALHRAAEAIAATLVSSSPIARHASAKVTPEAKTRQKANNALPVAPTRRCRPAAKSRN
ncbi:MAG: IclR family transcriptional regulator [Caldimonas sp.]